MLNKKYLLSFFLLLLFAFSSAFAIEPCEITKTIETNQWTQIGIPCEAPVAENTMEAIIADDITGIYNTDWAMFSFNPVANAYELMELQDSLEVGKGYWIIQINHPAILDMPEDSQPVNVNDSPECFSFTYDCFESTLVTTDGALYQMLANPFYYSVEGTSLRINTMQGEGRALYSGTSDLRGLGNKIWNYNGVDYDDLQRETISPWMGVWFATVPSDSSNSLLKLLFSSSQNVVNGVAAPQFVTGILDYSGRPPNNIHFYRVPGRSDLNLSHYENRPFQNSIDEIISKHNDLSVANIGGKITHWDVQFERASIETLALDPSVPGRENVFSYTSIPFADLMASDFDISIDESTGQLSISWPMDKIDTEYPDSIPLFIKLTGSNSAGTSSIEVSLERDNGIFPTHEQGVRPQ